MTQLLMKAVESVVATNATPLRFAVPERWIQLQVFDWLNTSANMELLPGEPPIFTHAPNSGTSTNRAFVDLVVPGSEEFVWIELKVAQLEYTDHGSDDARRVCQRCRSGFQRDAGKLNGFDAAKTAELWTSNEPWYQKRLSSEAARLTRLDHRFVCAALVLGEMPESEAHDWLSTGELSGRIEVTSQHLWRGAKQRGAWLTVADWSSRQTPAHGSRAHQAAPGAPGGPG